MAEYRLDIVGSAEGLLTGLNNAQEALQEVSAEAVATGKATQAAFAQTGGIEKMQRSLKDQFIFLGKTEVQLNKLRTALKNTFDPKEVAALNVQLKQTGESLIKFDQETDKTVSSQKSLKAQLRENKAILAEMEEQGLETTKSFFDLQVQTGKLQDQINDTNERIKFFGSDTKGLDGLIGVTKAATAGFAVGQGAAALFGAENENVQKALLKVNAAMAILNGLQEIQQALQKSSAARIAIETALQKVKIFFLGAETVATEGLTTAQLAAANAAKILRVALISTGILALVGLLIAAANAMGAFDEATQDATKSIDEQQKRLEEFQRFLDKQTQIDIARAKRKGATDDEIAQLEIKARQKSLSATESDIEKLNKLMFEKAGDQEEFDKLKARRDELRNQADRIADEIEIAQEEATTDRILKIREAQEKADEERIKLNKERSEKAAEDAKKRTESLLAQAEKINKQIFEAGKKAKEGFDKLTADPSTLEDEENLNKEILANKIKFLDDLETIALLQKDIEFEQGTKSIAETRRIAEEKLQIEIDFAQRRLDLLAASGGDEGQIKQLQLAIAKAKSEIAEMGKEGDDVVFQALGLGGLTEDEKDSVLSNLNIIKENLKTILNEIYAAAIQANEAVIDSIDSQIEATKNNIERQAAAEAAGRSSNLEAEKQHLADLEAAKTAAIEKQKKLQRQQLNIDTATQISSLITASAQIFAATSGLGPAGVALAIAAIATMFAAFAATQVKARQSINQQTLGRGGLVGGKSHDADGWGGNRYVSDTGDETYIERDEFVVNKKSTKKYRALIEAINADNLKQMLNGTGVQLSEEKIEAHKALKQEFANNELKYKVQMENELGLKEIREFRKDYNNNVSKQESRSIVSYDNGYRIEIRGGRTIRTKLL